MELLWPDQPPRLSSNNLHKTIHAARRALEPELSAGSESLFIVVQDQQILLRAPGELWIDAEAFTACASDALKRTNAEACERALELYAGDLLPEDFYQDWTRVGREHLGTIYQQLLLKLARMYEESGQVERSINLYMQLTARDRSNEEVWRQLMLLHALAGDRGHALHQYELCRSALLEDLDAQPSPSTESLRRRILAGEIKPRAAGRTCASDTQQSGTLRVSVPSNLPHPVTSFVGRRQCIRGVKRLLAQHRLVTITGTGGIGKTRLALQVAAEVKGEYGDGVWLVDLTSMLDGALVPRALVAVLGVREEPGRELLQTLSEFLVSKDVLLLLDNCEHLLASCVRLIDALLHRCPGLHIMATSREVLGVEGEALWRLNTLSVPEQHGTVTPDELLEYEAAQLFLERAALRRPSFKPTAQNASSIAQLCRRLDGIPLAIELAAARIEMLNVEQILSKLNDGFRLLATRGQTIAPRHQTLHTAIDWSYRLLHENERALLRRLSILAGEWSLEAAEGICTGDPIDRDEVLELLSNLVDKSLVIVDRRRGAQARYRLLGTIRQYAAEKLAGAGERPALAGRHFDWFLLLAEQSVQGFAGPQQRACFDVLELEHDNLRAALEWSIHESRDVQRALRMCIVLWRFWQVRGHLSEGRKWLELALSGDAQDRPLLRAEALHGASGLAAVQGDFEYARLVLKESLALRRTLRDRQSVAHTLQRLGVIACSVGDYRQSMRHHLQSLAICKELHHQLGIARATNGLGLVALDQGDYAEAFARFEESLVIYQRLDYKLGIMGTLNNLGETSQRQGEYDRADGFLAESLALAQDLGDELWIAHSLHVSANVAMGRGDYERARSLLSEALLIVWEIGDHASLTYTLESFACVNAAQGRAARALHLLGAGLALREALKMTRSPADQAVLDRYFKQAHQSLSADEAQATLTAGRSMPLEQVIEYALERRSNPL